MAGDRITIVVENGQIVSVTCADPDQDKGPLTSADNAEIVKNDYRVIASTIQCRLYPDGKCYYVIANRKYLCTCP